MQPQAVAAETAPGEAAQALGTNVAEGYGLGA